MELSSSSFKIIQIMKYFPSNLIEYINMQLIRQLIHTIARELLEAFEENFIPHFHELQS